MHLSFVVEHMHFGNMGRANEAGGEQTERGGGKRSGGKANEAGGKQTKRGEILAINFLRALN